MASSTCLPANGQCEASRLFNLSSFDQSFYLVKFYTFPGMLSYGEEVFPLHGLSHPGFASCLVPNIHRLVQNPTTPVFHYFPYPRRIPYSKNTARIAFFGRPRLYWRQPIVNIV